MRPLQGQTFTDAQAGAISNHTGSIIFVTYWESMENNLYLLMRKDDRLFPGHIEFRHLNVGHGIDFNILAVGNSPAHSIVKDGENRLDCRPGITVFFQTVNPVLDFCRRQRCQGIIAKTSANMPFNDTSIRIIRIGA